MKLCVVGIGGAGGRIASMFLENMDLNSRALSRITDAEHVTSGRVAGIWIEADKDEAKNKQSFFKDLVDGGYPGFIIPHDSIPDGCDLHIAIKQKYGYNVKKQGFVRDAQYLKAIFEIFDTDEDIQKIASRTAYANSGSGTGVEHDENRGKKFEDNKASIKAPSPIFDSAWDSIRPYTTLGDGACDGILFIVSFGGGTGTGFINPIIDYIRQGGRPDFPVFVLGILTEPGDFVDIGQNSKEGQRYLAATSALYDLLTKKNGANGIILMDNQALERMAGSDRKRQNELIHRIMKPMISGRDYPGENPAGQAMEAGFSRGLSWPPIFVPLYWSQPPRADPEEELVTRSLNDGRLFDCMPEKADKAVVFCRGFIDSAKIRRALSSRTGLKPEDIWVLRKLAEKDDEILILLRNPYGGDPEAYKRDGTLEKKFCRIIDSSLKHMNANVEELFYEGKESLKTASASGDTPAKLTALSKQALSQFFFGREGFMKDSFGKTEGFAFELEVARERLQSGGVPFFLHPLAIFKKEIKSSADEKQGDLASGMDEKMITDIIDRRVNKRLADLGLIKDR